jgi:hypothetical protein
MDHSSICLEELREIWNKFCIADIRAEIRNSNLLDTKQEACHQTVTPLSREQETEFEFLVAYCLLGDSQTVFEHFNDLSYKMPASSIEQVIGTLRQMGVYL